MYGFGGVGLSEVQLSISELSVVGGGWVVGGGRDKRTSWSDLVGVRQKLHSLCHSALGSLYISTQRSLRLSGSKISNWALPENQSLATN